MDKFYLIVEKEPVNKTRRMLGENFELTELIIDAFIFVNEDIANIFLDKLKEKIEIDNLKVLRIDIVNGK